MFGRKKKNLFDPIELEGADAKRFCDYLNGRSRDIETEKNRKATLERASKIKEVDRVYV